MFFLLYFVYYLHSLAVEDADRKNLPLAAAFLALTAASHVLAFGLHCSSRYYT